MQLLRMSHGADSVIIFVAQNQKMWTKMKLRWNEEHQTHLPAKSAWHDHRHVEVSSRGACGVLFKMRFSLGCVGRTSTVAELDYDILLL